MVIALNNFKASLLKAKTFPSLFWITIGATFVNQIGNMAYIFLVPYLHIYLKLSLAQAAAIFAVFCFSMLTSSALCGSLIDKFGSLKSLIFSLISNGVILLLYPFIKNYYFCLFITTLWGFSHGIYRPSAQTLVSLLAATDSYKLVFIIYRFALNIGLSIGPIIGGYLTLKHFPSIFIMNGIANLLAAIVILIAYLLIGSHQFSYYRLKPKNGGIKTLKINYKLGIFMLGMLLNFMIFFQHQAPLSLFISNNLQLPLSLYGSLFTINTLMIVLFEIPINLLTLNWNYKKNFILGSLLLTVGFAGMYYCSNQYQLIILVGIWSLGEITLFPAASSYIAEISLPETRGRYMSIYNTCMNLGMFLGPWLGTIIIQQFGYQYLWFICGLWGLLPLILFYNLSDQKLKLSSA